MLDPRLEAAARLYREEGAELALPIFEKLASEFTSSSRTYDQAAALHYIGECHWRLGNFPEAHRSLNRALKLERSSGDRLSEGKTLSIVALFQGLGPPVVQEYEVRLSGLPHEMDGTVLVARSDLHIGTLLGKKWLDARVAQVRAERPDIVLLLGDIFEGHGEPQKELPQVLHGLSAPLGVWAVLGNHEFHGRDMTGTPLMNIDGVRVLNNSWAEVRPGLILAGVDDLTANHRSGLGGDPVSEALIGRIMGATILLSHTPWLAGVITSRRCSI